MGWRAEYKLGDELIDAQHEELFTRTGALIDIIMSDDAASHKQECINAISFLKDYAVKHFAAEEAFQEARNYRFLEFHKAVHSTFITSVLEAEKKLIESDFSVPVIKEFCGFLSMWLIYHVAGADQKIVKDDVMSVAEFAIAVSYEDCVVESLKDVLDTIIGESLDVSKSDERVQIPSSVLIEIDYDDTRLMRFVFPKATALSLVKVITNLDLSEVDELAYAVLVQFANIICDNASAIMSEHQQVSEGDGTSAGASADSGDFFINTKFGRISISLLEK